MVNPAVYHASTILIPDLEEFIAYTSTYTYGRKGTPTHRALEDAVTELEGGHGCCLFPSGLSAITSTFLLLLNAGDHLLITDTAYQPTRNFCDRLLKKFNIEVTYYDPLVGTDIARLIKPNTKMIFMESPGSVTMEIQDVPAIVEIAKKNGITTVIDNTWSGGHYYKPLQLGCDISIQAGTKYIVGHSDVMLGTATVSENLWKEYLSKYHSLGQFVGPDDVYLALRGLRTLDVRMERHMKNALEVASWLQNRPEVAQVYYPALPSDAGHEIWKKSFSGACGLFSIRFKNPHRKATAAMIDNLDLFGIGSSWGGFESLVIPFNPSTYRTATHWPHEGIALRFHIGLEAPVDLIADLESGLKRFITISQTDTKNKNK